ncbi:RHS repeat-associated core domain-containing protein [Variovorax sp. PAMC26660]|uniref:RHS repeat-associated core domain-containing protein n=1 Tax=Variovorax sp. PAMC26660 TaxID=2762322 RepID=UPI00164E41D9|nr:RHS repeat-associated core domain-containing protein [Variovorax sp. PAMC26660]QNK66859.1 RHS repeat protein [Variovorax sp. PAMC26660]
MVVALLLLISSSVWAYIPTEKTWSLYDQTDEYPSKLAACTALGPVAADKQMRGAYSDYPGNWTILGNYRESENGLNCSYDALRKADGRVWVGNIGFRVAREFCPVNGSLASGFGCQCNWPGFEEDETHTSCRPVKTSQPPMCMSGLRAGNPILPATGEKYRGEVDWTDSGSDALSFTRTYRSNWTTDDTRASSGLGQGWSHNYSVGLNAVPVAAPRAVAITLPGGTERTFSRLSVNESWTANDSADTLTQAGDGAWIWRRSDNSSTYNFTANGRLQTTVASNGWARSYAYNGSGQVVSITNAFGRTLLLSYLDGYLVSLVTPDGRTIGYTHDSSSRLSSVVYSDGKSRTFLYESTAYPKALTGILDETGARWGTFGYDSKGRATSSVLAGGVDGYQVSYQPSGSATIIDPLGTSRSYSYRTTKGQLAVTAGSLLSGNGGSDAASRVQDANGFVTSETDFNGIVTTTAWDVARRLPTTVVYASGTPDAQTVTTQWHATFALPVLVTEAGRTTAYTYDTLGNALSKTITDTATNKTQLWQWTYTPQGLVNTTTEPNGAVTSYTYDLLGNVLTSTNALGHVTSYTYDSANRVASTTAPNGLVTTYTYDARDRLLIQTIGGQTSTLTYKAYGTVETITLPTGLVLAYTYDAAHRLTGWSNNRGESGTYTLDGIGNRTTEQIKDGTGSIAWKAARTINYLNRLSGKTEGPNQTSTFGYDANGELTRNTNGLNQSTQYSLDGLRRIKVVRDDANATATLKYNALDAVTEAKDFKGVATAYTRDAQGNATTEASADVGNASTQYDNLGLPSQITDALGQATTITRDALGRPTSLVFADGKTTTLRYDLTANSKGYLSEILDRSGTTEYTRDAFGRVTLKKQTLINGSVQQVSYGYNANGTLASIGYPNGATLTHVYDATGRLVGLNWNGNPLVTGIAWNPLGQPTAWTWAFANPAVAASRVYDTADRLTTTEFSSYVYDAAGRITSLTQNLYQPGDTDPTHSTISLVPQTWSVGYNSVGRITSFNATGNTAGFGYDANGNRNRSTRAVNGLSTSRTYTVGASSNQLTGFIQSINGASNTSVTYGYNANGDMVSDGLRSYTYDAEGRLGASTTGATDVSPTTRYAHNALGQRVFKTEPLYPPSQGNAADPGFMQSLIAFFTKLWSPSTTQAEQLGYAYVYDEQGTLIAEVGSGGTSSGGQAQYIYLPTANGLMPIAAVINDATYAVHSDHLNTPRKLTNADGQAVWQWGYSAFGEDKPTIAKNRFTNLEVAPHPGTTGISEVKFNLRYPGQYADEESGLFYNGYRTYSPPTGRYTQGDPIGLDGGWNRFGYVDGNPLKFTDPAGLQGGATTLPFPEGGISIPPWAVSLGGRALGVLGAALSLSGDTTCTCDEGYVSIYRVVSPAEFSAIASTQMYSIEGNPTGAGFKQFWLSPGDANWFQSASLIMDPRVTNTRIVTSKICKSTMASGTSFTDVGHPAISFDSASLPMVNRNAQATGGIIPYK